MDKQEFLLFCREEFTKRGFRKVKKGYYLNGPKDILCELDLQKSNFGALYYINYLFFVGTHNPLEYLPSIYEFDIQGRIGVMSKTQTYQGKTFMTGQIEYEEYTAEELRPYFDKAFEELILPPVYQGKKYILDNLNKLYFLTLRPDEVLKKLQE